MRKRLRMFKGAMNEEEGAALIIFAGLGFFAIVLPAIHLFTS